MIAITGASGQLGRKVIENLLKEIKPNRLIAIVRNPEKVADLKVLGVEVRKADYSRAETLPAALQGVGKLLLISSSEIGQRRAQHANVIEAAKGAGVPLIVYTSVLHADTSPLPLALEHRETEAFLAASGSIPFVLLRNGWYTENYTAGIPVALEHGAFLGCAGDGKIASAARADYAAAAAKILLSDNRQGQVYELAGDSAYTLSELAQEISQQSGKNVVYKNLNQNEYKDVLLGAGLPEPLAGLLAESDTGAAQGGLFDGGGQLNKLIGRATTPMAESVRAALS